LKFCGAPTSNNELDIEMPFEDFKKKEIKLVISRTGSSAATYYISKMELFRLVYDDNGKIIRPGDISTDGVVEHKQTYFLKGYVEEDASSGVNVVTNVDDITFVTIDASEVDY
jgi:hypothetical protein